MSQTDLIQQEIEKLKVKLSLQTDPTAQQNVQNLINQKQTELDQANQVQQEQQKMTDAIKLPQDYDTLWNHTGINAEMTNLIEQAQKQAFDYMNAQMADAATAYQSKIQDAEQAAQTKIDELQKQIQDQTELQTKYTQLQDDHTTLANKLDAANAMISDLQAKISQTQLGQHDAESKRDAAVKEAESLKAQINELEALNRTLKMDKPSGFHLNLTSAIKQEESKILSAAEVAMRRAGIEPLPVNQFRQQDPPTDTAGNTPVLPTSTTEVTFPVQVADNGPSGEVEAKEVTRAEFAALEARVKALEAK